MTAPNPPAKAFCLLENRGLIAIDGDDARSFLQGIVSNDVNKVTPSKSLHAAFLTAQGKYLHDFFMVELDGRLLLDCEAARQADLMKRLKMYKLRSKVTLSDVSGDFSVAAAFGPEAPTLLGLSNDPGDAQPLDGGVVYMDPRLSAIGARAIIPKEKAPEILAAKGLIETDILEYDKMRIALGLPDGSRDMQIDKAILLENGFEELQGVDWQKGCFMGQELTARTRYRALIKKRLLPIRIDGGTASLGDLVMAGDKQAGEVRSSVGDQALALLRLEYLQNDQPLSVNQAPVQVVTPDWVVLQKPAEANG